MAQDPYRYFRVEARELVDELVRGTLALDGAVDAAAMAKLLRLAHTLKGAARVVRQAEIADRAHAIEGALEPSRGATAPVPRDAIDAVLRLLDDVTARLAQLDAPAPAAAASLSSAAPAPAPALVTLRADVADVDDVLDAAAEAHGHVGGLRRDLDALDRVRALADALIDAPPGKARGLADTLRRELAACGHDLGRSVAQLERELAEVRTSAERMRLVPASALFTPLERTARDAAAAQDKTVLFRARGGEVRLDAHLLETVQGALVQLVRNAVAHGLEPAVARAAAGKPREGTVAIEVTRRGRRVAFTCRDDGRGIDLDAVRRSNGSSNGNSSSGAAAPDREQLLARLFRGGISTAPSVTELAGRGIGLDVVRDAAEQLGGAVTATTGAGTGTTVELLVPLTFATLPALSVESHGVTAAIPLDCVRKTSRAAASDLAAASDGDALLHDGALIPFLPLARALGADAHLRASRAWTCVIVEGAAGLAAIGVDRLLGVGDVLLRPLPELAPASPIVAGVHLDAEGTPRLVLDPDGLAAEARRGAIVADAPPPARPVVLVIDDSLTTRMLEQSILESAGYEVDTAVSGEDGLARARRRPYALFLVDVEMPGIDGFTFLERTRDDPELRGVPALLVTSRASAEDRRRGADVGARGYIVKSEFDQVDLLARIRELVS